MLGGDGRGVWREAGEKGREGGGGGDLADNTSGNALSSGFYNETVL